MRTAVTSILLAILLFGCFSCSHIMTGPVQHYDGQQLLSSEEATLHYSVLNGGIWIDGIWLGDMKPRSNSKALSKCVKSFGTFKSTFCEGTIKLRPGLHIVKVEHYVSEIQRNVVSKCQREMMAGVKYELQYRKEVIDRNYSTNKVRWSIWCEIN